MSANKIVQTPSTDPDWDGFAASCGGDGAGWLPALDHMPPPVHVDKAAASDALGRSFALPAGPDLDLMAFEAVLIDARALAEADRDGVLVPGEVATFAGLLETAFADYRAALTAQAGVDR